MSEQSVHLAEVRSELDELRSEVKVLKEAKSKLTSELSNLQQINQSMEGSVVSEHTLDISSTGCMVCV